jgi:hypothetical protein
MAGIFDFFSSTTVGLALKVKTSSAKPANSGELILLTNLAIHIDLEALRFFYRFYFLHHDRVDLDR